MSSATHFVYAKVNCFIVIRISFWGQEARAKNQELTLTRDVLVQNIVLQKFIIVIICVFVDAKPLLGIVHWMMLAGRGVEERLNYVEQFVQTVVSIGGDIKKRFGAERKNHHVCK